MRYRTACSEQKLDFNVVHIKVYEKCLKRNLMDMSEEDMEEHGRLICMKDNLLTIDDSELIDSTIYPYFYKKDLNNLQIKCEEI